MTRTRERQPDSAGWIIGAMPQVYLIDAAQGCGMYMEWMLEKSDTLPGLDQAA